MKYVKKPVVIDAVQWTGNNIDEICEFVDNSEYIRWDIGGNATALCIYTLEGIMSADVGDFIIKGIKGEFYPCKPDIFTASYEAVQ